MPRHLAEPIPVLVVASWFPSVDEPTRGRFIADQVTALAVSGRVEPRVVSFDTIMLSGEPPERRPQADAMDEVVGRAIVRDDRVFSPFGMHGAPGVPLARIPVPAAPPDVPTDDPSHRRETALRSLAGRVASAAVVHAHTAFPDGAASMELARRLGVPLVITEHASFVASILEDPPRRRAYLAAVDAASAFVAVSRTMGRELSDATPGLAAKLVVIPNAVDVDAFRIRSAGERRPDELLYVGYRLETKGIATLLEAFQHVR